MLVVVNVREGPGETLLTDFNVFKDNGVQCLLCQLKVLSAHPLSKLAWKETYIVTSLQILQRQGRTAHSFLQVGFSNKSTYLRPLEYMGRILNVLR